ncbi:N-acetyltransferase [Actibacterium sp. 188UL27-1]|nr:N-acetyltransferase [Actibacterium sp. 188UL27-1]
MNIRPESPKDHAIIRRITADAFAPMAFSDGTEADLIHDLRKEGDLILSLVAEEDDTVLGHIAFSPVTIANRHDGWFGLGPIAVTPDQQRRGIGTALIAAGLTWLTDHGAKGCVLTGNPKVYGSSGFESDPALTYRTTPTENVLRRILSGPAPRGEVRFAPAFERDQGA